MWSSCTRFYGQQCQVEWRRATAAARESWERLDVRCFRYEKTRAGKYTVTGFSPETSLSIFFFFFFFVPRQVHVHDFVSLEGFVSTVPRLPSDTSCPGVYSLDCDMVIAAFLCFRFPALSAKLKHSLSP